MIKKLKPHKCNWEGKVNDEKTGKKSQKEIKTKKEYQKPHIVHTKVIETLAGSCNAAISPPTGCSILQ